MKRPVFRDRRTATLDGEVIFYSSVAAARRELQDGWWPEPKANGTAPNVRYSEASLLPGPAPEDRPQPVPMEWLFGFAVSFRKAVDALDRKLQGRILEAMADLATAPITTRGDTVKALSGEMSGYWRYRIGDFRLVYYPDEVTRTITLCDFSSRGSVYD